MRTPFEASREVFNSYAGMDKPHLPVNEMSELQVRLHRWVQDNVKKHELPASVEAALGMAEELGELQEIREEMLIRRMNIEISKICHIELNVSQGRRYAKLSDEDLRAMEADALADMFVFGMQFATSRRLDLGTLLLRTAEQVMKRDWKANPETAHHGS